MTAAVDAQRFTVDELGRLVRPWDAAVDRSPDIDRFCSSSFWSFAAATSFPEAEPPVVVGDGDAFAGLRAASTPDGGRVLVGLDPVWGFASPVVGVPPAAAAMLAARLALEPFSHALVAGQREGGATTAWVVRGLGERYRLLRGPVQERLQIDLRDGVDGWLARRSARFRQRLGQLRRRGAERGLTIADVSALPVDELFDRVLDVEARSWKAVEGTGLNAGALADFYRQVCARLAGREQLRALLARREDRDVGYVLGGVRAGTYRGLQLSYDRAVADLGVGHLLQLAQLERLPAEGVMVYDLGMDMPYKRRWADHVDETFSIVVVG